MDHRKSVQDWQSDPAYKYVLNNVIDELVSKIDQ
jgi:hypothetical protein